MGEGIVENGMEGRRVVRVDDGKWEGFQVKESEW